MAEKKGKADQVLAQHFDKIILVVAVAVLGGYAYLGVATYKPDPAFQTIKANLDRLQAEVGKAHDNLKPKPTPDYVAYAHKNWDQIVGNFKTNDWACSYLTELETNVVTSKAKLEQIKRDNTIWYAPKVELEEPIVEIDKIKLKWSIAPVKRKSEDVVGGVTKYFEPNTFKSLVLERLAPPKKPGEKTQWEKVAEFEVKAEQPVYEYVDDKGLTPKSLFAYRVVGETNKPPYGVRESDKTTTPEKSVKTLDIWKVTLKRIVPKADEGILVATIEVSKFEMSKGKWYSREFQIREMSDFRIGGNPTELPTGEVRWEHEYEVVDPEKRTEKVKVNFNTGYRVKKLERGVEVEGIRRSHEHADPKDPATFKIVETKIKYSTDRVVFIDDEKKEQEIRRSGPVFEQECKVCVPPPSPKQPEDKKEEKK